MVRKTFVEYIRLPWWFYCTLLCFAALITRVVFLIEVRLLWTMLLGITLITILLFMITLLIAGITINIYAAYKKPDVKKWFYDKEMYWKSLHCFFIYFITAPSFYNSYENWNLLLDVGEASFVGIVILSVCLAFAFPLIFISVGRYLFDQLKYFSSTPIEE